MKKKSHAAIAVALVTGGLTAGASQAGLFTKPIVNGGFDYDYINHPNTYGYDYQLKGWFRYGGGETWQAQSAQSVSFPGSFSNNAYAVLSGESRGSSVVNPAVGEIYQQIGTVSSANQAISVSFLEAFLKSRAGNNISLTVSLFSGGAPNQTYSGYTGTAGNYGPTYTLTGAKLLSSQVFTTPSSANQFVQQTATFNTSGGTANAPLWVDFSVNNVSFDQDQIALDNVVVSGPATTQLTWNGSSGAWNTTALNFKNGGVAAAFSNGNSVTFDDTAPGTALAINSGDVSPTEMFFNNSTKNYTVSGANGITGGAQLTKTGTASLTISNSNSFTGNVNLSAGVINMQNGAALGASTGITVYNNATLQLQGGISVGAIPLSLAGSGTGGAGADGALVNLSGTNTFAGQLYIDKSSGGTTLAVDSGVLNLTSPYDVLAGSAQDGSNYNVILTGAGNGTIAGKVGGSGTFTKNGTGTWTFSSPAYFGGGLVVNAGTMILNANNYFSGGLTINGGTAVVNAANTYTGGTTINGGTLQFGDGTAGHDGSIPSPSNIADNGTVGFNTFGTVTFADGISGSGGLLKTGSGTLNLTGGSGFSGTTNVSTGKLYVTGSLDSTSAATVRSGATLGGTGQVNGPVTVNTGGTLEAGMGGSGQLTVASAVFQSGSNISFGTLSNYTGSTGINVNGTLNDSSGPVKISVSNLIGTSSGTVYRLINYSSITNFSNLSLAPLPSRSTGTLSNTINSNEVDLTIAGTDYLVWTGASTTAWNTSDVNWKLGSNGSPTTYIDTPAPDAVVFDDSTTATTVNLSTIVHPNSITFNNSSNNYVFQGTGGIAGATGITMNNGGSVTLATSNAFTGPVTVNSGALNLQNSAALGASSGVTIPGGGSISLNGGITTGAIPLSVSGGGGGGLDGAVVNLGGTNTYAGAITLTGDTTFASDAGSLTLSSSTMVVSNSHSLTLTGSGNGTITGAMDANLNSVLKSGTGAWTLSSAGAFNGFTEVDAGTLSVFGRTADGIGYLVNSGGTLNIGYTNSGGYASQIAFNGNGIGNTGGLNFAAGVTWNSNGGINLYNGATIVSTIGNTGTATIQPFDINSGNYINATSAASGTIFTSNINFVTRNYGYALTVDTGSNTATGDLTIAGVISGTGTFNEGSGVVAGFDKNGVGSLSLTGASTYSGGTDIANGSIILSGGNNRLPVATTVQLGGGTARFGTGGTTATSTFSGQLVLNGIQQQLAGILAFGAGTANTIEGGSATLSTLNVAFSTYSRNGTVLNNDAFSGNIGGSAANQNNLALTKTGSGTLTLSGSDTYTGGTNVSAGGIVFASAGAFPAFTPLILGATTTATAAVFTTSPKNSLFTTGLSIAGATGAWTAKLDLTNNDLVVRGGTLSTINNQVKQGYSAGTWQGSGGITSSSAAANSTHLTALGVISNSGISGAAIYSSFDGQTVNSTDVLVKYTYVGDANLDGKVDGSDYSRIDANYLIEKTSGTAISGWYNGDFNYDGVINGSDYTLMDNAFNTQGAFISSQIASPDAVATAQIAGATSSVPEPTTFGLLGIGAIGILGRRKRRQR